MPLFLEYIIVVVLGLVFGSFATALVHRVPRGMDWGRARSACPQCNTVLTVRDLVPVFSWLALRGKCRSCGKNIGTIYLWIELLTLAACIGIYAASGLNVVSVIVMLAMPFLVALLVIDLQTYTLPNILVLAVGILGVARLALAITAGSALGKVLFEYVLGAVIYAGALWLLGLAMTRLLKKDALGLGDVKFFAVAGLWLGLDNMSVFFLLSGLLGVMLGVAWKALKKGNVFPFGPALILSFYLLLII